MTGNFSQVDLEIFQGTNQGRLTCHKFDTYMLIHLTKRKIQPGSIAAVADIK